MRFPAIRKDGTAPFKQLSRIDLLICLALVGLGAVVRFWGFPHLGLTHFDEGTYAMAGRWLATMGQEGWGFPGGHPPPLFPFLLGGFFALFGVRDIVAIAVSALAGSLTVGLIYLIGADWFNRSVGLVAALLLATCEYHLIYSRMALTDATFTFLFWASLVVLFEAARSGRMSWAVAGGLLCGLCWNTKYNGFFPLLMVAAWLILKGGGRPGRVLKIIRRAHLLPSAATALAAYLPWVIAVELTVGYASLLGEHFDHVLIPPGFSRATLPILVFYLSRWLSLPLLVSASIGLAMTLRDRNQPGLFLILVVGLFSCAALFYMAFPRLVLPLVPAVCLLAARGWQAATSSAAWLGGRLRIPAAVFLLAWNGVTSLPLLGLETDSYRKASQYLQSRSGRQVTQLNKNFYLYEDQPSLELRRQDLSRLDERISEAGALLAVDPILHRLPAERAWLEERRPRLLPLTSYEIHMYEPAYYQGFDPFLGFDALPRRIAPFVPGQARIEVFRLLP